MDKPLKIVFLFSGQGSQYRGMGRKLFEENKVFRETIEICDAIIEKQLSICLVDEIYFNLKPEWNDLLSTHPAILAVQLAMNNVLRSLDIVPDFVWGTSLGEFAAGVASNIWSIDAAMSTCIEQAKAITRNNIEGGMITVIGKNSLQMKSIYLKHHLFLASDNFENHFTLAGLIDNLHSFQVELLLLGIDFFRLPVNIPFHCKLLDSAANSFFLNTETLNVLNTPTSRFISGMLCKEIYKIPHDYFWNVISKYNNISNTVDFLEKKGQYIYIDLGPSGTCSTFVKYNLNRKSLSLNFKIMSPYGTELKQLNNILTQNKGQV